MAEIIKPLYMMILKDSCFEWNEVNLEAFERIKSEWKRDLNIKIPDMNKRFTLEVDASDIGLGAILKQDSNPIAYVSRSLSSSERNYSITEREVLAVLWAMEKLEYYLLQREFDLITDHKAI